jgi:tetratricopeptide (TPR) repeat protein
MRYVIALAGLLLPLSLPAQAAAPAQAQKPAAAPAKPAAPAKRGNEAETLLQKLAKAETAGEARRIERQLQDLWSHSGSATADLLLERSAKLLEDEDVEKAKEVLEKLTGIAPKFAEAWYQRATIAAQMDDYEEAVTALRQVLALQPKHFVAMAQLATILEEFGDKEHALAAYRQAAELNPFIEGVEDRIRELSRDVEGQGI